MSGAASAPPASACRQAEQRLPCREPGPSSAAEVCGQTLVMQHQELQGRDITLANMRDCRIFLLGSPAALRLRNLHSCQLASGPVSGPSFLDGELCKLHLCLTS